MPDPPIRRLTGILFSAVALATTGYIAAITVSTLAAREITGSATAAGVPAAAGVVGVALGTSTLGQLAAATSRRLALSVGYLAAAAGAATAALSVASGTFWLLVVSLFAMGFGQAASQLARYTAADMVETRRRGVAVSLIVWAGTIGAVVGPRLLEPAGAVATGLSVSSYAGGYGAAFVAMLLSMALVFATLRPDPSLLAFEAVEETGPTAMRPGEVLRIPAVQVALVAMVVGQIVMVLIMTATPIHIEDSGFGLGLVGTIISLHTLGMFALSPLTGRLVDRIGSRPVIAIGTVMLLASALLAAIAPRDATALLGWALFLLGLGWNFGFVGGSALLARETPLSIRPLFTGRADSAVWLGSALASSSSGLLLAGPGYPALAVLGAALSLIPMMALIRLRPATGIA